MTTVDQKTKDVAVEIGRTMREARQLLGLTQGEVARRSGIPRNNVSRMESGRHVQRLDLLVRYAEALKCCPCLLLTPICKDKT